MKHIQSRLVLSTMLAAPALMMAAPASAQNESDSTQQELVNVAFRSVAKSELLGGVSVVNVEELTRKSYSTYSLSDMSALASGWNGNSLWGQDGNNAGYLVLVDGVPREATNVLPTEIAQISFLKGAQAVVLYGSRAAKGAIVITTKRGKRDGLHVDARLNTGWAVAKSYPEYLGSAEYMTLYNEAYRNDGNTTDFYSQENIYNHASGINPYHYPNINYYGSDYIKKAYNRSEATAEIEGGGERAHFYSNVGYTRAGDYFKFGEAKHNYTDRLNVRGNVDMNITSFIKAFVNANATFYNQKGAIGDYWSTAATARPNRPDYASPLIPISLIDPNAKAALDLISTSGHLIDGQYFLGGTRVDPTNIIADYYAAGKSTYTSRQFQFDAGVNIDLAALLKGLSFQAKYAVDYASQYTHSYNDSYAIYTPTWSSYNGQDVIVALTKEGTDEHSGVQNVSGSTSNRLQAFSAQINYDNTFGGLHNVSAMLLANGWQRTVSGTYHRTANANLGLMANYNFARKYYAEFSAAAIHSARLAEGHREAISPSLTLGWRLSEEGFLKGSSVVDDLLLSVSASSINQDIDLVVGDREYYLYEPVWDQNDGYGWYDGSSGRYTISKRGANPDLGFIKRKEFSANLRGSFFQKLLTLDASFFITSTNGLLISTPTFYPQYMATGYPDASFIPYLNYNNNRRSGFDFALTAQKRFGEVDLALGFTGTYYTTKATRRDENNEFAYQNRQGQAIDGIWGYQSMGLFQSEEEISNAPTQNLGSTVKPGDIRYKDQNGDGVIDSKDQVFLGKGGWYGTPLTLGMNFTAKWRGFTLFAAASGYFGGHALRNSSYWWVSGDDKYSAAVRDRWTPETAATATYPRLTTQRGSNNFTTSDFWMYSTNRVSLSKVQLTYDMPSQWFTGFFMKGASVYVSGTDLLMIGKHREWMEMNVGTTPQNRFFNIGAKLSF